MKDDSEKEKKEKKEPVRTVVGEIGRHEGREVILRGWLAGSRSSGKLHFLQVRDGTGTIQCVVFKGDVDEETFSIAARLPQESSLLVTGLARADKRSPIGYELGVKSLRVIHRAGQYPLGHKDHGPAFLHDRRHLWLRSSRQHAIMRVRASLVKAVRDYFDSRGFLLIDAPIFTPNACEGTTTLFSTDYFGETAYLTQSGQLYMEAAAMAHGKVYCLGPTFRAEKSKTRRHLTEFWMVEPEMAWCDLEEDMSTAEDFVANIVARVIDERAEELKSLERDTTPLEKVVKPFPRISYDEAIKKLRDLGVEKEWGGDFGAEEETALAGAFDRPVLVHRYPRAVKAFYMKGDPEDGRLALCVDMLAPEGYGEIVGGGQREDDLETLEKGLADHGLPRAAFEWYLDLRRYGSAPHAGFGLGIERTVAWICGLRHVRETIPFPRTIERLTP